MMGRNRRLHIAVPFMGLGLKGLAFIVLPLRLLERVLGRFLLRLRRLICRRQLMLYGSRGTHRP